MNEDKEPGIANGTIAHEVMVHCYIDIVIAIHIKGGVGIEIFEDKELHQDRSSSEEPFSGHAVKINKKVRGRPVINYMDDLFGMMIREEGTPPRGKTYLMASLEQSKLFKPSVRTSTLSRLPLLPIYLIITTTKALILANIPTNITPAGTI